jgi:hypothetical protein
MMKTHDDIVAAKRAAERVENRTPTPPPTKRPRKNVSVDAAAPPKRSERLELPVYASANKKKKIKKGSVCYQPILNVFRC